MNITIIRTVRLMSLLSLLSLILLTAGCGGSAGSSAAVPTTTITGSVFAAAVSGASVTVRNGAGSLIAGPVTTAVDGSFSIAVPNSELAGALRFQADGGTFNDEATAATVTAGRLSAYVPANRLAAGSTVSLDPANTIIHDLVVAGKSPAEAETAFNAAFGYTPDVTVLPRVEAPNATNLPQRLAALRAAAFSYLAQALTLSPAQQFGLTAAIARDLGGNGILDGKDATASVIAIDATATLPTSGIQYNYAVALKSCGDARPTLGLTSTTVQTASYRIEYLPGMMAAAQGKTSFRIRLTSADGTTPQTGKSITLVPVMHMPSMSHRTPLDPVISDNGDGTYSCTVYYLMMSSASMGFWELRVSVDGETAVFYPSVGMAMGTALTKLYGVGDKISDMLGAPAARTYFLFRDGVSGNTFNLFIAALDDALVTSFPAVSSGQTLHDQSGTPWTVNPATTAVALSSDNITYYPASDSGNGHWTVTNAGLNLSQGATVHVRLTVNGEAKTNQAGTQDYASFILP